MSRSPWAGSTAVEEALGATPLMKPWVQSGEQVLIHTHTQIR